MLLLGECELSGAQGCGNGAGDEEWERVVGLSKEESGVRVSERLRLRPAIFVGIGDANGIEGRKCGEGVGKVVESEAIRGLGRVAIRGG